MRVCQFRHSPERDSNDISGLCPLMAFGRCRSVPVILRGYDRSSAGKGRFVGVLQRFERRLGGLVEGAFAKVFKGDVQPVEVAGALQRETDDKKTIVGQGKVLVPNDFVVELGQPPLAHGGRGGVVPADGACVSLRRR